MILARVLQQKNPFSIYGDLMGLNGDLMGLNGDLMGFSVDSMGFDGTKNRNLMDCEWDIPQCMVDIAVVSMGV